MPVLAAARKQVTQSILLGAQIPSLSPFFNPLASNPLAILSTRLFRSH